MVSRPSLRVEPATGQPDEPGDLGLQFDLAPRQPRGLGGDRHLDVEAAVGADAVAQGGGRAELIGQREQSSDGERRARSAASRAAARRSRCARRTGRAGPRRQPARLRCCGSTGGPRVGGRMSRRCGRAGSRRGLVPAGSPGLRGPVIGATPNWAARSTSTGRRSPSSSRPRWMASVMRRTISSARPRGDRGDERGATALTRPLSPVQTGRKLHGPGRANSAGISSPEILTKPIRTVVFRIIAIPLHTSGAARVRERPSPLTQESLHAKPAQSSRTTIAPP